MKLSTRLTTICQAIAVNEFKHIWDCCCDHGYLGQQLMAQHPGSQIHFVDVVPHLIDEVESRLNSLSQPLPFQKNWAVHCIDAAAVKLDSRQSHLIIIAGVGGDLLIEMVKTIVTGHPELIDSHRLDFILCPVRQLHKVREGLQELRLGLVSEIIVKEKDLFYEVIRVSATSNKSVSLVGNEMWDLSESDHVEYQQRMIDHYIKQPSQAALRLLSLYQAIP
jgi:tRNA (adenine22-N1)-methyltransferase